MASEFLYKITVETVRTPEGAGETPVPFSFEVATQEDIIGCIDRTQTSLLREATQLPALIVGLKLLGGIAAQHKNRAGDDPLQKGLREFVRTVQALAS